MTAIFADASFYIACVNPRDELHSQAKELAKDCSDDVITSEFVLLEVGNWLSRAGDKPAFLGLMNYLREDQQTQILPVSTELFRHGFSLFAQRLDKDWSLTDCISLHIKKEKRLTVALTSDHHFKQAGYRILLTSDH
jgi:predicted nucleic acid-binding protein